MQMETKQNRKGLHRKLAKILVQIRMETKERVFTANQWSFREANANVDQKKSSRKLLEFSAGL